MIYAPRMLRDLSAFSFIAADSRFLETNLKKGSTTAYRLTAARAFHIDPR